MAQEHDQTVSLACLVSVEHSSATDSDIDYDSALDSSALVREHVMVVNRKEVQIMDDIREVAPNMSWSQTNAHE